MYTQMDPKKISSLDPKLRETYERIMGTSPQPVSQAPAPTSAPVQVPTLPQAQAPIEQKAPEPQAPASQPQAPRPISGFMESPQTTASPEKPKETLPPSPFLMQTQTVQDSPLTQNLNMNIPQEDFTKSPLSAPNNSFVNPNPSPEEVSGMNPIINGQPQKQKKKNKFFPIILSVGIIVFFVIYAVVWAKVFSLF